MAFAKTLTSFPLMKENVIMVDISNPSWKNSVNVFLLKEIICNLDQLMFLLNLDLPKFKGQIFLPDVWKSRNEDPTLMLAYNTLKNLWCCFKNVYFDWIIESICIFKADMQGNITRALLNLKPHIKDIMNGFPKCGTRGSWS